MAASLQAWLPTGLGGLAVVMAAVALWLAWSARRMSTPTAAMKRLQDRVAGPEGEQLVADLLAQVEGLSGRMRDIESLGDQLRNQLRGAVQRVGLERFNADQGLGGNLSFALVMLDSRNHGVCLTSIHSLEACRIFLRAIIGGKTDHPMLDEEKKALEQALRA